MNVLVACEFSGIVRNAFIKRGHNAISCDLLPTEIPGPHITGDILTYLNRRDRPHFDLMIAHPEWTYLCLSGVRWLYEGGRGSRTPLTSRRNAQHAYITHRLARIDGKSAAAHYRE